MMRRMLRNKKASAWRMASQIVTLSGLTRLKSIGVHVAGDPDIAQYIIDTGGQIGSNHF